MARSLRCGRVDLHCLSSEYLPCAGGEAAWQLRPKEVILLVFDAGREGGESWAGGWGVRTGRALPDRSPLVRREALDAR